MYYVYIQEAGKGKTRNEQNKLDIEIGQNQKSSGKRGTLIKQRPWLTKAFAWLLHEGYGCRKAYAELREKLESISWRCLEKLFCFQL